MGMKIPIQPNLELTVPVTGGIGIHCRCYGTGDDTLVLLHGNGEDYRCFSRQLKPFSEKYRVVAIDSRGHGSSGMGEPFHLRTMASDVVSVLDALQVKKASVVGFSDGGNIALYFALGFPSRLNKLVIAGANLFPAGVNRKSQRPIEIYWKILNLLGHFSEKALRRAKIIGLMVTEPDIDPWELESIEAPTLVLAGERDLILGEHTKLIAQSIPNAHLRIIPASDHFIFENNPQWTNTTILQFLSQ